MSGRLWVHNPDRVIPKTLKMVVVAACLALSTKEGPQNKSGRPGVSIM